LLDIKTLLNGSASSQQVESVEVAWRVAEVTPGDKRSPSGKRPENGFTVLGDTVSVAARLEQETKAVELPRVVSAPSPADDDKFLPVEAT
jgi:hypothetical protein